MTNSKKKPPLEHAVFVQRSVEVESAVQAATALAMQSKRMTAPRDAETVFAEIVGMVQGGCIEMAKQVFLDDASMRERWFLMRGRLTETEFARLEGRIGGKKKKPRMKTGRLTEVQQRRVDLYHKLHSERGEETLGDIAALEECSPAAIRDSLKAANIIVSTNGRRGRRPK